MDKDFYIYIGYAVVKCMKYIFMPFGVSFFAGFLVEKALRSQPKSQRKKRSRKNRFK